MEDTRVWSLRTSGRVALMLAVLAAKACGGGEGSPEAAPDASSPDAPESDAPGADRPGDAAVDPPPRRPPPPDGDDPYLLSETGLYADIARKVIAPGLVPFAPTYELWSDGARKRRWIELPPGTKIDTSDMNHWRFPVGTRVFKEFSRDGVLLETRLIERTGPGAGDYWMGAFVWKPDGSDAVFREDGEQNINGTDHDAPSSKQCSSCHGGEPGRLLGFSAVQLFGVRADGVDLRWLRDRGLLSHPPAEGSSFEAPGDAVEKAAFGYLHANCGHCHSRSGLAFRETDQILRLSVEERAAADTAIVRTSLGVRMQKFRSGTATVRVVAGEPEASGLVVRMRSRERNDQMPPLATKHVDAHGVRVVSEWIRALPRP